MNEDDWSTFSLFRKCSGITNNSSLNFAIRIFSIKTVSKYLRKLKVLWTIIISMCHLYLGLHPVRQSFVKNTAELLWNCVKSFNCHHAFHEHKMGRAIEWNVKYKRTDAPSLWHQQQSTTVDIHGPLQTRGDIRCPGGVSVSCLASRTRHECLRHNESVYMEAWHWM